MLSYICSSVFIVTHVQDSAWRSSVVQKKKEVATKIYLVKAIGECFKAENFYN